MRDALLAAVDESPAAVAAHDKPRWLALFTTSAVVNDPVGSAPHRGAQQLARFYDTFIAPNRIRFEVAHDIVCGRDVLRDLTIVIAMSDRVTLRVPAHLHYSMTEAAQIDRLAAHWELGPMIGQLLGTGAAAAPVAGRLSVGLLRNQRLGGALGFARGFGGVGARAKRQATALLQALAIGDVPAAERGCTPSPVLRFGGRAVASTAELGRHLAGWRIGKTLAAGRTVSVTLTAGEACGVALVEFAGRAVSAVTVYVDD